MSVDSAPFRPAWVEVNLSAIEYNTRRLVEIIESKIPRSLVERDVELMAMVKANAYGHGAVEVARAALRGGAKRFGVISVGEAAELRHAGITAPVLVLGATMPEWARAGVENDLSLTIFSMETARALAGAARELNTRARVHIKVDTGMTRLGVLPDQVVEFARAVRDLGNVEIEGVYTHFAVADTPDVHGVTGWGHEFTQQQLVRFRGVLDALDAAGIRVRYRHCANSPASLKLPEARLNLIRSGILIYGLSPSDEVPCPRDFIPALAFKTRIASVKSVPAGTYVGYGCTFRTLRASRIAVIMVGYADGFRRKPHDHGEVLVRDKRAPVTGRVCMDQTMVDVTDIEGVQAGDEVVLIGTQGAEEIRAEDVGKRFGSNNYETVTTISARVERRYITTTDR
jgi:alanine racemase